MSKTPYPTIHAIEDMFTGANGRDSIVDNLDDNCDIKVTGYDHHFAGEEKGKDSVVKNVRENIFSMLNENTIKFEVVHVIGGGDSPWAAVECKGTGKSKTGKKFVHEHVYIVRFNGQGKIVKMRSYLDSHHLHSHAVEQGKASS